MIEKHLCPHELIFQLCKPFNCKRITRKVAETHAGKLKLEHITRTWDAIMDKLEGLLTHWINSHNHQFMNLSWLVIHEKVLSLFKDLKKNAVEDGETGIKHHEYIVTDDWLE
jgi:hypothetical protein